MFDVKELLSACRSAVRIGFLSVRANVVPLVVLWGLAAALAVSYYTVPEVAEALEPLSRFQKHSGCLAAFANRVVFCGLLPGVFLFAVQSLRPQRPLLTIACQSLWCGLWGAVCDFFYRFLEFVFGSGADFPTLLAKTCANQFVWTPLVIAPVNAVFFFWLGHGFSFRRMRDEWPGNYAADVYAPNLVANWIVWVPVFFAIYAFPQPLQVQLSGLVGAFWSLVCIRVGVFSGRHETSATRA